MSQTPGHIIYGEIGIGLHRSRADSYDVELRGTDPGAAAEIAPNRGPAGIRVPE